MISDAGYWILYAQYWILVEIIAFGFRSQVSGLRNEHKKRTNGLKMKSMAGLLSAVFLADCDRLILAGTEADAACPTF